MWTNLGGTHCTLEIADLQRDCCSVSLMRLQESADTPPPHQHAELCDCMCAQVPWTWSYINRVLH